MIVNGDFEHGLKGWRVVSGSAFSGQPIEAATINAKDVLINGAPLVGLGGDFWHTPQFPIGQNEKHLIRTVGKPFGVLESDVFEITLPFLAYRLGGSPTAGSAIELRVPSSTAKRALGFPALDAPDADGFVAVRRAVPDGSDILREYTWSMESKRPGRGLVGAKAKIRLSVTGEGVHRLLVDDIRLEPTPPPPFRPPLWGWADLHCHPMAQAGFGGLFAGQMHGPVEDLGSCVQKHGVNHSDPFRPLGAIIEAGRLNDGSVAPPGWTIGVPGDEEQFGFRGWPAFDDLTHMKVHQDWLKRAWEGGQRLMVALIVHSELLATVQGAPQSDRDTVEPQIQMLKEFVAHNGDWCGLATTPDGARDLIQQNKLAFVLGIETDSINGWVYTSDFDPADRVAIHTQLHGYFEYLKNLGVVQVNLIHLSDNAFGGMALYDLHFMLNTWARTQQLPTTESVPPSTDPTKADDDIYCRVTVKSALWSQIESLAIGLGWAPLTAAVTTAVPPPGDRNAMGMTVAGEEALLEAMHFGMVIDLDHMSEKSAETAHSIAMKTSKPYPLVSAHNGARRMAPRPLSPTGPPSPPAIPPLPAPQVVPPKSEYRRGEHLWPNENAKSSAQLTFIKETGGMFGHGTAAADSRGWGTVDNDCPGSDKTFAQGYQYVLKELEVPIGLGTDWNSLLSGPGPRFGTQAANGLQGEVALGDTTWARAIRSERLADAKAQTAGVAYSPTTPLIDWRDHRFPDSKLYQGSEFESKGERMWQALAVVASGVSLALAPAQTGTGGKVTLASMGEQIDPIVLELALGMTGMPSLVTPESKFHRVGAIYNTPFSRATEDPEVVDMADSMMAIQRLWDAMTGPNPPLTRAMAGPKRDFDYNLDGLAHYGMFPDMFQDLKNVGFPPAAMSALFGSAEKYISVWEASVEVGAALPHP